MPEKSAGTTFFDQFTWYFIQLISAVPGVMVASIPFWAALSALGLSAKYQPRGFAGYEALVSLFAGIPAGWWMARRVPRLISTGRWIWLAPAAVVLTGFLYEQLHAGVPWLSAYLFASRVEGITVLMLTLPACSAMGYSIGMAFAGMSGRWSSPARFLTLCGFGVVFCGLAAFALHDFEQRSVAQWATVRSVTGTDGLPLVRDAESLCGPQTGTVTERAAVLQWGTYVDSMERRVCGGALRVDRVRVLNGPDAGLVGWVSENGLEVH